LRAKNELVNNKHIALLICIIDELLAAHHIKNNDLIILTEVNLNVLFFEVRITK